MPGEGEDQRYRKASPGNDAFSGGLGCSRKHGCYRTKTDGLQADERGNDGKAYPTPLAKTMCNKKNKHRAARLIAIARRMAVPEAQPM